MGKTKGLVRSNSSNVIDDTLLEQQRRIETLENNLRIKDALLASTDQIVQSLESRLEVLTTENARLHEQLMSLNSNDEGSMNVTTERYYSECKMPVNAINNIVEESKQSLGRSLSTSRSLPVLRGAVNTSTSRTLSASAKMLAELDMCWMNLKPSLYGGSKIGGRDRCQSEKMHAIPLPLKGSIGYHCKRSVSASSVSKTTLLSDSSLVSSTTCESSPVESKGRSDVGPSAAIASSDEYSLQSSKDDSHHYTAAIVALEKSLDLSSSDSSNRVIRRAGSVDSPSCAVGATGERVLDLEDWLDRLSESNVSGQSLQSARLASQEEGSSRRFSYDSGVGDRVVIHCEEYSQLAVADDYIPSVCASNAWVSTGESSFNSNPIFSIYDEYGSNISSSVSKLRSQVGLDGRRAVGRIGPRSRSLKSRLSRHGLSSASVPPTSSHVRAAKDPVSNNGSSERNQEGEVVADGLASYDVLSDCANGLPSWLLRLWLRGQSRRCSSSTTGDFDHSVPRHRQLQCQLSSPLLDLLLLSDLAVTRHLCAAVSGSAMDDLAKALVCTFDSYDLMPPLLRVLVAHEVEQTLESTTLFRGNSTSTKALSAYAKSAGKDFLKSILGPPVFLIRSIGSLEVDSSRANETADLEANLSKLMSVSQEVLDKIIDGLDLLPLPIREAAAIVRIAVGERFPAAALSSVGSFLFLRFLCPALINPEAYGYVKEPPTILERRSLVLVSKCLQNLANGVEFGMKEQFMIPVNAFIRTNTERLNRYFDALSRLPCDNGPLAAPRSHPTLPAAMIEENLSRIGTILGMNIDKVAATLTETIDEDVTFSPFDDLTCTMAGIRFQSDEDFMTKRGLIDTFEQLLFHDGHALIDRLLAVLDVLEYDEVAQAIMQILVARGSGFDFLCRHISAEIESATNAERLYNGPSVVQSLLLSYTRLSTTKYLQMTLRETIEEICTSKSNYEVDPSKLLESNRTAVVKENMACLITFLLKFFGSIINSLHALPNHLHKLLVFIHDAMLARFSDSCGNEKRVISAFLFPHFFCRAIMSPTIFGLVDVVPSLSAHRTLTFLSRALGNLATDTPFKEPHLQDVNLFLEGNKHMLDDFLEKMIHFAPVADADTEKTVLDEIVQTELAISVDFQSRASSILVLHKAMSSHLDAISEALARPNISQHVQYRIFDRLSVVLAAQRAVQR